MLSPQGTRPRKLLLVLPVIVVGDAISTPLLVVHVCVLHVLPILPQSRW